MKNADNELNAGAATPAPMPINIGRIFSEESMKEDKLNCKPMIIALTDTSVVFENGGVLFKAELDSISEDHLLISDSASFRLGLACARRAVVMDLVA